MRCVFRGLAGALDFACGAVWRKIYIIDIGQVAGQLLYDDPMYISLQ